MIKFIYLIVAIQIPIERLFIFMQHVQVVFLRFFNENLNYESLIHRFVKLFFQN